MESMTSTQITVQALVNAPVKKVWESWSQPNHITKWCQASEDWHAPYAENDLRTGGKFKTTMAAKDGSVSFDFEGTYSRIQENTLIEYAIADGRKVRITFEALGDKTKVTETFEAEGDNSIEMQRGGWQAILDNFKNYTERLK
jgi:uncharacterized protein YndB with AHSA1/START domain